MSPSRFKSAENVGYALFCALLVMTFLGLRWKWAEWVTQAALGCAFVVGFPTMLLTIRREWRGK